MNINTSSHFVYRAVINKYTPPLNPPCFQLSALRLPLFSTNRCCLSKRDRGRVGGGGGGGKRERRNKKHHCTSEPGHETRVERQTPFDATSA